MFKSCASYASCNRNYEHLFTHENQRSAHWRDNVIKTIASKSGKFMCQACNCIGCASESIPFFVTDIFGDGSFAVDGPKHVLEGGSAKLKCSASVYHYIDKSIYWYKQTSHGMKMLVNKRNGSYEINSYRTKFSFGKELYFRSINLSDRGRYVCRASSKKLSNSFSMLSIFSCFF